jgi:hypothetical protein
MGWIALTVAAILAGKCLSFTDTLREAGELMAKQHGIGFKPIIYQNSITPPWLTKITILCWLTLAGSVVLIWYGNGWVQGLAGISAALLLPVISQAVLPPRRGSPIYLRTAFHTLSNRSADYARAGDHERAAAAKMALQQFYDACPDIAPISN